MVGLADPPLAAARVYRETKTASGGVARYAELVRMLRRHGRPSWGYGYHAVELVERWLERSPLARLTPGDGYGEYLEHSPLAWAREAFGRRAVSDLVCADGWAGPAVTLPAPEGDGPIILHGVLPDWAPLTAQQLEIHTDDGAGHQEHAVGRGSFAIEVSAGASRIEIRADGSFSPHRAGLTRSDRRRLSWMLLGLERQAPAERLSEPGVSADAAGGEPS